MSTQQFSCNIEVILTLNKPSVWELQSRYSAESSAKCFKTSVPLIFNTYSASILTDTLLLDGRPCGISWISSRRIFWTWKMLEIWYHFNQEAFMDVFKQQQGDIDHEQAVRLGIAVQIFGFRKGESPNRYFKTSVPLVFITYILTHTLLLDGRPSGISWISSTRIFWMYTMPQIWYNFNEEAFVDI